MELEKAIEILKETIEYIEFSPNAKYRTEMVKIQKYTFTEVLNAIKTVLQALENSISKEVIEEKHDKYKQQLKNKTKRVMQLQMLEQNGGLQQSEWEELNILFGDIERTRGKLEVLQELLEGK